MRISRKTRYIKNVTVDSLINFSFALFAMIYLLPISIVLPETIRSSLQFICVGMVMLYFIIKRSKYLLVYITIVSFLLVYYTIALSESWSITAYMATAVVSSIIVICAFLTMDGKLKLSNWVIWLILLLMFFSAITTIIGLIQFPIAIRQLSRPDTSPEIKTMYRQRNIAGWELLYGMTFLQGSLAYLWKRKRKIQYLIIAFVIEVALLYSQLAFAIIFSALIIFFVMILGNSKKYKIRLLLILIAFLSVWVFREHFLKFLLELADKTGMYYVKLRARNLYDLIIEHNTMGDAGTRFELYWKSFSTFIHYPLGIITAPANYQEYYLGFHSEFFDTIGAFGVFGLGITIWLWGYMARKIKKRIPKSDRMFMSIMFGSLLLFWIINPVFYAPQIWFSTLLVPANVVQMLRD